MYLPHTDQMYWNAVFLMAWSLATVTAILDSTTNRRYWEDTKPEETARYQNDNMLKTYVFRGGNKQFVTSVFPGKCEYIYWLIVYNLITHINKCHRSSWWLKYVFYMFQNISEDIKTMIALIWHKKTEMSSSYSSQFL
jgi:hypothetical protein